MFEIDEPKFMAHLSRGLRSNEGTKGAIVTALLGALELFKLAYNRISDGMPEFLAELESIWPEAKTDTQ